MEASPLSVEDALAIDNSWASYAEKSGDQRDPVILDFTNIRYLGHDTLLHLGALIRYREVQGLSTQLELPSEERVWQYMRAWKFPQFIEALTLRPFETSLTEPSQAKYHLTRDETPRYVRAIKLPGGGDSELLSHTNFQLIPIRLDDNPMRTATWVQQMWLDKHLVSILDAYLDGRGERVGSLVVLEAVLNAAMHPNANVAFISSQIVMPIDDKSLSANRLEIGIWDDGLAIADTLKARLEQGLGIKTSSFGEFKESFDVRLVRSHSKAYLTKIGPEIDNIEAEFPWLTVAAFLAGVSAMPERSRGAGDTIRAIQLPDLKGTRGGSSGMGLPYIRRNVLNLWQGEIRYSSGSYRMFMKAGDEPNVYKVSIHHRPENAWPLLGNNLTIHIPLAERKPIWG